MRILRIFTQNSLFWELFCVFAVIFANFNLAPLAVGRDLVILNLRQCCLFLLVSFFEASLG